MIAPCAVFVSHDQVPFYKHLVRDGTKILTAQTSAGTHSTTERLDHLGRDEITIKAVQLVWIPAQVAEVLHDLPGIPAANTQALLTLLMARDQCDRKKVSGNIW